MNWKEFISDYLIFSRKERIAVLLITLVLLFVLLTPQFYPKNLTSSSGADSDTAWIRAAKKLENKEAENKNRTAYNDQSDENNSVYQYDRKVNSSPSSFNLFYFDPNTIDEEGWKKLGLKEKTIRTIQNYLGKGGRFYKADDLKKIYGLRPEDYFRLEPYIKIESSSKEETPAEYVKTEYEPKKFSYTVIDINAADTTAYDALPGIGSKLAARIVNFRDKLGGFYSISQIGETYGLPDSTFQKIKQYLKLGNASVKKININTATVDELKAHPYIKYSISNPIIAYRNEHGPFAKVEDIKKVMAVTEEVYNKIAPYLTTQ